VAILPFYIELSSIDFKVNLKFIRVLRVIRMARIFKLYHSFNVAMKLVSRVLDQSKQILLTGMLFLMVSLTVSGMAMFYCERGLWNSFTREWQLCTDQNLVVITSANAADCSTSKFQSVLDGFWWSIVTITTGTFFCLLFLSRILTVFFC